MAFHDNQDRDNVLAATDLVDVVAEHVALRPKGREFVGLCCFHDDKKPSMFVNPGKQIFKCFACGAGGSVFDFVMRYHKLTFPEALKFLADRAGVQLTPWKPRRSAGGGDAESDREDGPSLRERLAACNEQAAGFYRLMLKHAEHGQQAREYLASRAITPEMVERFQIGVAPNRWDGLSTVVGHKGWDADAFLAAGLIKPRKRVEGSRVEGQGSGEPGDDDASDQAGRGHGQTASSFSAAPTGLDPANCFDMLRHRLIFPICDALGRPVAFGGRRLDEADEPKYLNSPETPLFNKSATLYGLHLAKKPIIDTQTAVLVEGYTDVVACHQHGACNVVAALGTALTAEHARALRRYCEKVVLVMDGDEAGQRAADRAIETFLTADLDVFLAIIPGGADPDEFLRSEGLGGWEALIAGARDALAWQFDQLAAKLGGATTVTGRQRLAEQFAQRIVDAGFMRTHPVRRSFVTQRLSELMSMPAAAVAELLASYKPRSPRVAAGAPENEGVGPHIPQSQGHIHLASRGSGHRLAGVELAERRVIAVLITDNELFHATLSDGSAVDEAVAPAEFVTPRHRLVYQRLFDALCDGRAVTWAGLLTDFAAESDPALAEALAAADHELTRLLGDLPARDHLLAVLEESANALLAHHRHRRFEEAKAQLNRPTASAPAPACGDLSRLQALIDDRKTLQSPKNIARVPAQP